MATGMVLSVAQTLFSALQCKELRELCCMFGYHSQLEALRGTVETIKNVLLDAESKQQELNSQGLDWLNKLKDAVYDADDLFDEFATIAQRQKRMPHGKISKTVRAFFSSENQFLFAVSTSQKIKKIREKLDSVAKDRADFGFSNVYRAVKRKEETWSYVHEHSIIGRDIDKEAIIDMLLRESIDSVSFVSIVGMGGLGKTALAQLVYNDGRIKSAFELKLWVCVSDDFSIEEILHKMLKSAAEQDPCDLAEKNDVWNESRDEWLKLREFLQVGARGSRIVVTTRSEKVGGAIGDDPMYALRGLQDDDSWLLFKRISLNHESKVVDDDLVCIGKEISIELPEMDRGEESIMPILKFSYHHLPPQLKSCFSYCALFPKDYAIVKNMLICLWSALGYLKPLNDMQSIEDVDIERDSYGEIYSCGMHDLIHDLAQEVAGKELCLTETSKSILEGKRHLSLSIWRPSLLCTSDTVGKLRGLRTFLRPSIRQLNCESPMTTVIAKCKRLRVLDLHHFSIKVLPSTIKNLLHLRYLDLSYNMELKILPESISRLYNLQALNLRSCLQLKELPKDVRGTSQSSAFRYI
ncbi:putative disease resistance protein RGA1 [Chenopodium quinoa]|uniref:putative disease resistance protein RGA1 n=1 Tax=Chenopodium quinoa TaxID=63459 RepID=UPI000B76C77A|nr:putative disease resistance protein RGA1 [Chenopodium quinoa]